MKQQPASRIFWELRPDQITRLHALLNEFDYDCAEDLKDLSSSDPDDLSESTRLTAAREDLGVFTTNLERLQDGQTYFPIARIARADLLEAGFDGAEIIDAAMETLASKMGADYVEQLFWSQIPIIGNHLRLPLAAKPATTDE